MMNVLAWLGALSSLATACGVFLAARQLALSKQAAVTQFEDQLNAQYRELVQRLPVEALLGEELSEDEQREALPEFYHYFDLSNEQAFLHQERRVSAATWRQWEEGIVQNLSRPAFWSAWDDVSRRAPESFDELRTVLLRHGISASADDAAVPQASSDASVDDRHEATMEPVERARRSRRGGETTRVGYVNRNGQMVLRATGQPGNDHLQFVYALRCTQEGCGHEYGANGSDIFQRKCPRCQGGAPGLPLQ